MSETPTEQAQELTPNGEVIHTDPNTGEKYLRVNIKYSKIPLLQTVPDPSGGGFIYGSPATLLDIFAGFGLIALYGETPGLHHNTPFDKMADSAYTLALAMLQARGKMSEARMTIPELQRYVPDDKPPKPTKPDNVKPIKRGAGKKK